MSDRKSPYTNSFRHHIVSRFLKNEKETYSSIADASSLSYRSVSKIIYDFARQDFAEICPDIDYNYLQLYQFHYHGRDRFYLAEVTKEYDIFLLKFFGFEDTMAELKKYFEDNQIRFCTDTTTYIATNTKRETHELLLSFIPGTSISYDWQTLYKHFESYKIDTADGSFNEIADKVTEIEALFRNWEDDSKIYDWCENMSQTGEVQLHTLRKEVEENLEFLRLSAECFTTDFTDIDEQITSFDRSNLPFDAMVLRMMYQTHGDSIFKTGNMNLHYISKQDLWGTEGEPNISEIYDDEILNGFEMTDEDISFY